MVKVTRKPEVIVESYNGQPRSVSLLKVATNHNMVAPVAEPETTATIHGGGERVGEGSPQLLSAQISTRLVYVEPVWSTCRAVGPNDPDLVYQNVVAPQTKGAARELDTVS
jgi:hypothetical protein